MTFLQMVFEFNIWSGLAGQGHFREWLFDELAKTHEWSNQVLAIGTAAP
jgi:hypothetical protein